MRKNLPSDCPDLWNPASAVTSVKGCRLSANDTLQIRVVRKGSQESLGALGTKVFSGGASTSVAVTPFQKAMNGSKTRGVMSAVIEAIEAGNISLSDLPVAKQRQIERILSRD